MKRKPFTESFQEAVQKTWSDALKGLQSLEEEVSRRYRQVADRPDLQQGSEELQRFVRDLGRRLQQNSEAMEQRLEESVRSMSARLPKPMLDEVARLRVRAEQLATRLESQLRKKSGGPTPGSTEQEQEEGQDPPPSKP
jgi:ubiquinone biosynthesis protein UbiJ